MVRQLVTFDPGETTGWAAFFNGKLIDCGYVKKDKLWDCPVWKYVCPGSTVLVEVTMMYPSQKEKNPGKIFRNGVLSGEVKGFARALGALVEEVLPRRWKGTIPKPKTAGEQYIVERRVLKMADAEEARLIKQSKSARAKGLNHNVIDAVGIGFWREDRE